MGSRIKESPESTFEVYVEVTQPGTAGAVPEVRRQFPEGYTDQETLRAVSRFCFPFCTDRLSVSHVGQNFTFVLTDIESKQRFGFCRLTSGARSCFCILSYLPWFEVFYKLLNVLVEYAIKGQDNQKKELLETLYALPIPDPGVPVHLSVHSHFTVPNIRELPSIPENRNLTEYFVAVDVNNILHLYASMLFERRILVCCSKLSTLTACVHGSAAMLYPMYWQHVYIPVLPQHLIDYCCAPMPYLIGVHSSLMERVKSVALEDVVILNVDTNTLETPYDDLQNLPNDTVSSLKSRLKKVSTATGDGVARAFLKAQAALFGSYRNALRIEPGEPITFSEEAFLSHRSTTMRTFLQNAMHLQLFKQFIDGRLDLLNSGEGFSDVFEEEINLYAGSDKNYHQWLSTVKKGSGALFNTVKTKANPAMRTVYKFARDHAKMGIKEVKSRLKQKELPENGYPPVTADSQQQAERSPSMNRKDVQQWDERRPITVHYGQARPPRPQAMKRTQSNVALESSNPEQPRPYRALKEVGFSEEEEPQESQEAEIVQGQKAPPSPRTERVPQVDLLSDIFGSLEVEPVSSSVSLTKSLDDLRPQEGAEEQLAEFGLQCVDDSMADGTHTLPSLKHANSPSKLWGLGLDDMALPSTPVQGSITVPRPQGRKTPEPGTVLAPPASTSRSARIASTQDVGVTAAQQEFLQALNTPLPSQKAGADILKPVSSSEENVDLLSLLDPLCSSADPGITPLPAAPSLPVPPQPLHPQTPPTFPDASLNPFVQTLRYTSSGPPRRHYAPAAGNPFSSAFGLPTGRFHPPSFAVSTPPTVYGLPASAGRGLSLQTPSLTPATTTPTGLTHTPQALSKPRQGGEDRAPQQAPDPFADLLSLSNPAAPPKKQAEDLRQQWETFD
ncbi:DENN domain-containing protein 1A-like isoform X2 [Megalops cyprinoides]|uniref:DENN domain-containing protein 1A-like isoform X2 n=1 Tax=Megalops cyprinoides TaxID=118141 RepID=UPI001864392B|nr:DENN domain-containing protein 1A-like isoform X2 [Megalops cyprinoides]